MAGVDVVVVGGGISGLAVADGLTQAGLSVTLLEARRRLGGRIDTVPVAGGVADLGATWFWPGQPRVQSLVGELNLDVHPQWATGEIVVVEHGQVEHIDASAVGPALRFSGGAAELVHGLAARLPDDRLLLDHAVDRIQPGRDTIDVHVGSNRIDTPVVVMAVPAALAVNSGIIDAEDLDSGLRAAVTALPVWMAATVKAVAVYEHPFWRDQGLTGTASTPQGPLHEVHDMSGPDGDPAMLFGFGHSRPEGHRLTPAVVADHFASLFGSSAATPLEVHIRDWGSEPRTAPTPPPSTRVDLFGSPLLQAPTWDGRLFWTGTETSTIAPGHIEGALAAAERTVEAVLRSRPQ